MSLFSHFIDQTKGHALSMAGKQLLAFYLAKYGTMLNFSIDPETRTVTLEMLLKGEKEPMQVTLRGYEILEPAGGKTAGIRVAEVKASREWLEVALRQFVEGRTIDLPASAAPLLKMVL
jgi:hypothetical protein